MADKDTAKQMRRHYTQMVLFEAQQLMLVMMSDNVDATDDVDVSEKTICVCITTLTEAIRKRMERNKRKGNN